MKKKAINKLALAAIAVLVSSTSLAASDDPLAATGSAEDALSSPLQAVTVVTDDAAKTRAFYEKGMAMNCAESTISKQQSLLWKLDGNDWVLNRCKRSATQGGVEVRVLSSTGAGGEIRDDFDVNRNGLLSLGFAIKNIEQHKENMEGLGYPTNDGVTTITLPTTSGGTYTVKETHYRGPHNSYNLGIERPEGFASIGEVDSASNIGGPSYSGVIADDPDAYKAFMETVLGFQARRDIEFESSGPGGGLIGIAKGTKVRFIQMYSPGSTTDYIIVMGMGDSGLPSTAPPQPPSKGVAMWSFNSNKFDQVLARAKKQKLKNLVELVDNGVRVMSFDAPNGVLIEVSEQQAQLAKKDTIVPPISEPVSCADDAKPALLLIEGVNADPVKFKGYTDALQNAKIYEQLEGYYMTIGDPVEMLEGEWPEKKFTIVARFPCEQRAHQFWHSDAYKNIKPLRQGAGDVRAMIYSEFAVPERIAWKN